MKRRYFINVVAMVLGLANIVVHAQEATPTDEPMPHLGEVCQFCNEDGWIGPKNKTVDEDFCRQVWGDNAPRRWYVGRCWKYTCLTGHYYVFGGWEGLPAENCTTSVINPTVPLCPDANCIYLPIISDPLPPPLGQGHFQANSWDCPSLGSPSVTSSETSKLVREAMKANAR